MPPELEILMWLPVKSPELVSFFIEASRNFKSGFSKQLRYKKWKTISAYTESAGTDLI